MPDIFSPEDAARILTERNLGGWFVEDGWIRRKFSTHGWPQTMLVVNAIGFICEQADHHADLAVTWARVIVKLKTHSVGAITEKDFELARRIEDHLLWTPAGALEGPDEPVVFSK